MTPSEFYLKQDTDTIREINGIDYVVSAVQLMASNDETDYTEKLYNADFELNEGSKFCIIDPEKDPIQYVEYKEWVYEIPEVPNPVGYVINATEDQRIDIEVTVMVDTPVDTNGDGVMDSVVSTPTKVTRTYYKFPIALQIKGTELPDDYKIALTDDKGNPRNSDEVQSELSKEGYVIQNEDNLGIQLNIYQLGYLEDGTAILSDDKTGVFHRSLEPYFKAETLPPPAPEEIEVSEVVDTSTESTIVDYDDDGNPIYEELETGASSTTGTGTAAASAAVLMSRFAVPMRASAANDDNPNLNEDYESKWSTDAVETELDKQCSDQRSKSKFIKVAPGMLKLIVATQCNYLEELNNVLKDQVQNISTGAELRLKFNLANNKALSHIKKLIKLKDQDESAYFMYIPRAFMAFTEYFSSLQKLAGFNEKFYYKEGSGVINGIFSNKPDKCFFQYLYKNGIITDDYETGKWIFDPVLLDDQDHALHFLSPDSSSVPSKQYLGEEWSPGYDYYTYKKVNGKWEISKKPIDMGNEGSNFDPNVKYIVGRQGEYAAKKSLLESLMTKSLNLCVENTSLYDEYKNFGEKWDNWKPIEGSNKYTLTTHKFYSEGISRHRAFQYTRMKCKDASRLMGSNWFADQWNSASTGDKYKDAACKLMSLSTDVFKQIPSQIKQAVQSIVEPMSAIVVTPIGPGGVATNILQILGTIGKITTAVSAVAANLAGLLATCGVLGADKIPVFAVVTAGLGMLMGLLEMIQSILSKLPSI